jgi:hypothetical protein
MTVPSLSRIRAAQPRRLHLILRDGTMVEGHVQIGEDQALVSYLNSRRGGWMNVTRAHRPKLNEQPGHLIVQTEHVIMASAPDKDAQVTVAPAGAGIEERPIEIVLLGGKTVHGFISTTDKQRLSDYIGAQAGRFMGLQRATLAGDGRSLGDLALQIGAIELLRDLRASAPIDEGPTNVEPLA